MIYRTILRALVFGVALCAVAVSASEPTPKIGERIVYLGNGFIEREQNYGHFETALQLRFPNRDLVVRNMGDQWDTPDWRVKN